MRLGPAFLLVPLLLGGTGAESAPEAPAWTCRHFELASAPAGMTRATWSSDGAELILLDPAAGRLLRYSNEGKPLGAIARPGPAAEDFPKPSQLHATAQGFVVRSSAYRWVWLDRQFKSLRGIAPARRPPFNMVDEVLTGDKVEGFGPAQAEGGAYVFGFLRGTLRPMALQRIVKPVPLATKAGSLYTELFPLVASAAGRTYGLWLGEPSSILDLADGTFLKAFPAGFAALPELPRPESPAAEKARAQALRGATLPTALYGQGAFLYLLTRQPGAKGQTVWKLHRIDPRSDRLLASFTLPSGAPDLALAPGPVFWALIEKGLGPPPSAATHLRALWIDRRWFESAAVGAKSRALQCD